MVVNPSNRGAQRPTSGASSSPGAWALVSAAETSTACPAVVLQAGLRDVVTYPKTLVLRELGVGRSYL